MVAEVVRTRFKLWPYADPRLLKPNHLKFEHRVIHRYLDTTWDPDVRGFIVFRHELIRIAVNQRTGHKHAHDDTLTQRAHKSPVSDHDLTTYLTPRHLHGLTVYERWVYLRKRTDTELVHLLFLAFMKRMQVYVPPTFLEAPWEGTTPMEYLAP